MCSSVSAPGETGASGHLGAVHSSTTKPQFRNLNYNDREISIASDAFPGISQKEAGKYSQYIGFCFSML